MTNTQHMTDAQIAERVASETAKRAGHRSHPFIASDPEFYRGECAHDCRGCEAYRVAKAAILEALSLRDREEWISVEERLPDPYSNVLIAHTDTSDGTPTVEEAQHEGAGLWCLVRCNPCDDPIYVTEQVYAWRPLPLGPLPVGEVRDGK